MPNCYHGYMVNNSSNSNNDAGTDLGFAELAELLLVLHVDRLQSRKITMLFLSFGGALSKKSRMGTGLPLPLCPLPPEYTTASHSLRSYPP